ncbi:MAG: ParB/RepB/Spo0J family partition protein [Acidimicrobiia bacterium]
MARPSGLGKGLGALIPPAEASREQDDRIFQELPIGAVQPNPNQPRTNFDEEALVTLAASVREVGVLQPILVRPIGDGHFEIIAGERRWRAAKRVGLASIPAIVRESDDLTTLEHALIENLHRSDLSALEEAAAYQQLIEDFSLTHEQVATRVGRSRTAVTNTLRLLHLPATIQHFIADGRLSAGHARALLASPDRAFQEALARRAVNDGMSVRAVEEAVKARGVAPDESVPDAPKIASSPVPALRPPGLLELEELLSSYLDTRVSVTMGASRGKVSIEFATLEDLERIYRLVTEHPQVD